MTKRYIIRIDTESPDGEISSEFLTKNGKTYIANSLFDAIEARDNASKWVKGNYTICILQELPNV